MPLQSKSPLAHPYLHGEWRWVHAECLHFGQGHAGEGGRGGPKTGLRPARGPSRGRWPGSAPRAPAAARARSREAAAASVASAASAAAPGGLGWGRPDGQTDRGHRGRAAARAGHGGRLVWRGPRGGRLGPRELRAAAPNPVAGRVLGVLHRRVRTHCQRGLRERRQRPGAALRLQRERGRLPLRRRTGPRGFPRLRRLPAARHALPADQQRPRPPPRCASRPGLLRALVLPVVRGLLLPHQSVAAHGARARHHSGGGRGAGGHRFQLLLDSQLGGAHREGPAAVPPGHRHVALRHRAAGRRGGPGLPWLPRGQRRGGHRDLPEPALHRDSGHQPQRVPGARLLVVVGRLGPGLEGHPTNAGLKASWDLCWVLPAQRQGQRRWSLWTSGAEKG